MILTDASVFIAHRRSRGRDRKLTGLLATLPVAVVGLTRSEVLAGANSPADRVAYLSLLNGYLQVRTDEPVWDAVGDHRAALRRAGVQVPYQDVLLATIAIDADLELWARDHHFPLIQKVLPALRLFVEPP